MKKITALLAMMTMTFFIAHAQRTFDDLLGRKLIAVGYAWPDKLDGYGKPQMYHQQNPMTWQLNNDGTLLWSENGERTYQYTVKDSMVILNAFSPSYELKFFVPWIDQRDSPNYKAYITAQSNDGIFHYFTLSQKDCYELYEKALDENRLYAAYDYMCLVGESGDCLAECALGYLEEIIDDFPGDDNGVMHYLMADYNTKKTPEESAEKSRQTMQLLAESGLVKKEIVNYVAVPSIFFTPSAEQKQILSAFSLQRVGIADLSYSSEEEEERIADISAAVENFQKAIETTNDAVSNFYFGKIYYEGLLGFKEKARGLKYIEIAAAQGSALANCYLGNLKKDDGDIQSALKLWKIAAKAQLQRPQVRISTIETLKAVNPDMPEVRAAVKEAKENLKKYAK